MTQRTDACEHSNTNHHWMAQELSLQGGRWVGENRFKVLGWCVHHCQSRHVVACIELNHNLIITRSWLGVWCNRSSNATWYKRSLLDDKVPTRGIYPACMHLSCYQSRSLNHANNSFLAAAHGKKWPHTVQTSCARYTPCTRRLSLDVLASHCAPVDYEGLHKNTRWFRTVWNNVRPFHSKLVLVQWGCIQPPFTNQTSSGFFRFQTSRRNTCHSADCVHHQAAKIRLICQ